MTPVKSDWITPLVALAAAALVIGLYLGGEAIEAAIAGEAGREAIIAAIWNHVGWGVVTAPLIGAYVVWRLMNDKISFARSSATERASKISLWVLSALLVFLVVSGPIVVWTYGSDLKVFDWFVVPTLSGKVPVVHDPLEAAHVFAASFAPWVAGAELVLFAAARMMRR